MEEEKVYEIINAQLTKRLGARFLKNGKTINLKDVFEVSSYFMAENILSFQSEQNRIVTWDIYLIWQKGVEKTLIQYFPKNIRESHLEIIHNDTTTLLFTWNVDELIKIHKTEMFDL